MFYSFQYKKDKEMRQKLINLSFAFISLLLLLPISLSCLNPTDLYVLRIILLNTADNNCILQYTHATTQGNIRKLDSNLYLVSRLEGDSIYLDIRLETKIQRLFCPFVEICEEHISDPAIYFDDRIMEGKYVVCSKFHLDNCRTIARNKYDIILLPFSTTYSSLDLKKIVNSILEDLKRNCGLDKDKIISEISIALDSVQENTQTIVYDVKSDTIRKYMYLYPLVNIKGCTPFRIENYEKKLKIFFKLVETPSTKRYFTTKEIEEYKPLKTIIISSAIILLGFTLIFYTYWNKKIR